MFGLGKTTVGECELLRGFTDYHCHILPGVDDGFHTLEDSLKALRAYERVGIHEVWLTPHVMEEFPNSSQYLKSVYRTLADAYYSHPKYQGTLIVNLAAEYMLDGQFRKRLEESDVVLMGDNSTHLLVETSYFNPPVTLWSDLRRIMAAGLFPVLAHPERYLYMDARDYRELKNMGVWFQLNVPSLLGQYGADVRRRAEGLLKEGFYELAGTDLHRLEQLERMQGERISRWAVKLVRELKTLN